MPVLEAEAPVGRNTHEKLNRLIQTAQQHPPVTVAVAHPCDQVSLESAVAGAEMKRLIADFDRDWPDVKRSRDILILAEELPAKASS